MNFEIDISSTSPEVDRAALEDAIRHGLVIERVSSAILSVSVVDNAAIHALNRQHLQHDYPTDVISFQLHWSCADATWDDRCLLPHGRAVNAMIEGEIVVSYEYAAEMAQRGGWAAQDELTLYAIHGMLHICGYDDLTGPEKKYMRARERANLDGLGLTPQYPDDAAEEDDPPGQQNAESGSKSLAEDPS